MFQQKKLKIENISGTIFIEKFFDDTIEMLRNYGKFLINLDLNRFDYNKDDIFIFQSPTSNMVAYKNIFGNIEFVTTDLFYRRYRTNDELIKKVKSITGE